LTETRQRKLLLSIRGKAYLANTSPKHQFEQLILWYLQRYDWTAWYDSRAEIAAALQGAQRFLWRYFLSRKGTKIDFSRFLSGIREYFGLDALSDEPYFSSSVRWAVEQMLVRDLRLFGLLSVDKQNPQNSRRNALPTERINGPLVMCHEHLTCALIELMQIT
jgi:hypothetical protein